MGVQKLMFELLNLFSLASAVCLWSQTAMTHMYVKDAEMWKKKGSWRPVLRVLLEIEQYMWIS